MSLLLDALKKAEKAKEDARRRAEAGGAADSEEASPQIRTRNELPDISKPLDIHADDMDRTVAMGSASPVPDAFSTAPAARPAMDPPKPASRDQPVEPPPRPRQAPPAAEPSSDAPAQKAAAKKVFEAKFREPNPKLPFYITMAVLGLFSLGTVIYFWYQLRPPPPLINTKPQPPSNEKKTEQPPAAPQLAPAPQPGAASPILGLPQNQASAPATPPPVAAARPAGTAAGTAITPAIPSPPAAAPAAPAATRQATTTQKPAASSSQEASKAPARGAAAAPRQSAPPSAAPRAPADPSRLSVNRAAPAVDPKIDAAWQAYNKGDLQSARSNYQAMLRDDPLNRDALLGMAAVEIRTNRPEQATAYYQSLLHANPRDTHAQAGLLALRSQMGDSVQTESRVKSLLASDPDAQILYFTLGNQYAQQGRWPEAQQAYFKAYTSEPENPDFAYNLAVSLDQVRQPKLALEYYRKALSLSQQRASSFDQTLARNRVQELSK